jgi:hypothetical protein
MKDVTKFLIRLKPFKIEVDTLIPDENVLIKLWPITET